MGRGFWCGVATIAVVAACPAPSAFLCDGNDQCVGGGDDGVCLDDGYCAFPDPMCASGLRYGSQSGPNSGQCAPVVDAGTAGSTSGSATTTTGSPTGETTLGVDETAADDTTTAESTTEGAATTDGGTTDSEAGSESSTGSNAEPSLVLWLTFDNLVDGGLEDASAAGNHGACTGGACPVAQAGALGDAARFDGVDDVVSVEHDPAFESTNAFTVMAWLLIDEIPMNQAVFTKTVGDSYFNSWELYFGSGANGRLLFSMAAMGTDTTVNSGDPIPLGQWVHLAGRWDGELMSLWIDGALAGSATTLDPEFDDHPILVGADDDNDPAGLDHFLNGAVDDARVYNRALSAREIGELAKAR